LTPGHPDTKPALAVLVMQKNASQTKKTFVWRFEHFSKIWRKNGLG
jgi:hypothetical protein